MRLTTTDGPGVSAITDHAFIPRGEWWSTCGHFVPRKTCNPLAEVNRAVRRCRLAEAAHASTTVRPDDRRDSG